MRKSVVTTLAFSIASLFAAAAILAVGAARNGDDLLDGSVLAWGLIFYCYTLGAALIIGLPAYVLLKHFDKVAWWSAMFAGMFSGALMAYILQPFNMLYMVIGGLSGLVFWLVWRLGGEENQKLRIPPSS